MENSILFLLSTSCFGDVFGKILINSLTRLTITLNVNLLTEAHSGIETVFLLLIERDFRRRSTSQCQNYSAEDGRILSSSGEYSLSMKNE